MDLQCVCGYKYKKDDSDLEPLEGDEEFIKLNLSNHIKMHKVNTITNYYGLCKEITLYACPKCHTIKIL